jgi:deazaflavin-dependent oxidoreductase (nitroreductase family)
MATPKIDLNMSELMKMSAEVAADDGPGSSTWNVEGTITQRVNDTVMEALRQNQGKLPGELAEMPCVIITTTGAKSGKPRTVPLAYQSLDDRILIIASMGGSVRNPPWFHNLVQNPEVTVELGGETYQAKAIVTEGADRDGLFGRICTNIPTFAAYQERTERVIPVVELKRL